MDPGRINIASSLIRLDHVLMSFCSFSLQFGLFDFFFEKLKGF